MSIEQYLVPSTDHANICFSCRRACGGCSWSEIDPLTDKPRFQPVPGWTAKPSRHYLGRTPDGRKRFIDTWHITACPLYIQDRPEPPPKRPPPPPPFKIQPRPVEKLDAGGKVVAEYPSVSAAARANPLSKQTILDLCNRRFKHPRAAKGCDYRFKAEEKK